MKKERVKEFIIYAGVILIGVACFFLISARAEQIDKMEAQQYEKIN